MERRDFIKSTHAAAQYLKDLKKIFDKENPQDKNGENWYLAFAAYNCGASRVLKEMKRSNSNNFWDLNRLPGQTRNYVPKILAFFLIISSVIGAQLGVLVANKLRGEEIRALLAVIVLVVAVKIALDLLVPPEEVFNLSVLRVIF